MPETISEATLESAGLSKNEAKVYVALLKLGQTGAREIIATTGLYSANVYAALERLVERGLAGEVQRNGKKHYAASDPHVLLNLAQDRERALKAIMPSLEALRKETFGKAEASLLHGKEGLRALLEDILEKGEDYYALTYKGHVYVTLGPVYMARFHRDRVRKKIWRRVLYSEENRNAAGTVRRKYSLIRFLPKQFVFPAALYVYADTTALVIEESGKIFEFIIRSKGIADGFRNYWKLLNDLARP